MKKKWAYLVCACLCAVMIFAAGCDKTPQGGTETGIQGTLTIMAFNGGYGLEWLRAAAGAYERANDKVKVDIRTTVDPDTQHTKVRSGLYVGDILYDTVVNNIDGRLGHYIDIKSVYEAKPKGETKTVTQKLGADYVDTYYKDCTGKYFSVPVFDAMYALHYNKTSLDIMFPGGWQLPVTTDELYALCQQVIGTGNVPFTYSLEVPYMDNLFDLFFAQLEGYESYLASTMEFKVNGVEDTNGAALLNMPSRRIAVEEVERFYKRAANMTNDSTKSMDFVKAQAYFWGLGYGTDKKLAAFMMNGDWLYHEMDYLNEQKLADIRMMKTPITSRIADSCSSISGDIELAALVRAVDDEKAWEPNPPGVETITPVLNNSEYGYNVSEEDWYRIYNARKIVRMAETQQLMMVPKTAKNYDLAQDFLIFMASDEACYYKSSALYGDTTSYNRSVQETTVLNEYIKSKQELTKDAKIIMSVTPTKLVSKMPVIRLANTLPADLYDGKVLSIFDSESYKAQRLTIYKEERIAAGLPVS